MSTLGNTHLSLARPAGLILHPRISAPAARRATWEFPIPRPPAQPHPRLLALSPPSKLTDGPVDLAIYFYIASVPTLLLEHYLDYTATLHLTGGLPACTVPTYTRKRKKPTRGHTWPPQRASVYFVSGQRFAAPLISSHPPLTSSY